MTGYGEAAINAVNYYTSKRRQTPEDAWNLATEEIFGKGTPSQKKGCPRNTFLGLCEEGKVKDIPKGYYTRSKKNKDYALKALGLLHDKPLLIDNPMDLWNLVLNGTRKKHNYQMDVVIALFSHKLINL